MTDDEKILEEYNKADAEARLDSGFIFVNGPFVGPIKDKKIRFKTIKEQFMRAKPTVDTLEKLIDQILKTSGIERTSLCMTIDSILDKFEDWVENSQDAKDLHPCPKAVPMFITEMKAPLYCLAGLNDFYTAMDQCVAWLRAGLRKMSMQCYLDL